jgi:hypothetical protein
MLAVFVLLEACDQQANSPVERQESRSGVEEAAEAAQRPEEQADEPASIDPNEATKPPSESGISQQEWMESEQGQSAAERMPAPEVPTYPVVEEENITDLTHFGDGPIAERGIPGARFSVRSSPPSSPDLILNDIVEKHQEYDIFIVQYVAGDGERLVDLRSFYRTPEAKQAYVAEVEQNLKQDGG